MSCLPCVSSVFTHEPIVHVICKALVKNSFSQHASSCSRDSGGGDGGDDKHLSLTSNTATGHENHESTIMNLALINKAFANTMRTYRSLTDRLRKNKPKDNNAAKTTNKLQTTTATQTQGKHSQKLKEDVIAMMERAHTNLVKNKTLQQPGHAVQLAAAFFDAVQKSAKFEKADEATLMLAATAAISVAVKATHAETGCHDDDNDEERQDERQDETEQREISSAERRRWQHAQLLACVSDVRRYDVSKMELAVLDVIGWQTRALTPSVLARSVVLPELLSSVRRHLTSTNSCCAGELTDALLIRTVADVEDSYGRADRMSELANVAAAEAVCALTGRRVAVDAAADALFAAHEGCPRRARALRDHFVVPTLRTITSCSYATCSGECTCAQKCIECVIPWTCPACDHVAYLSRTTS